MAVIEEPSTWTTATMDHILFKGDELYQNIDTEHQLLLPTDLPTCVTVCDRVCHIITGKEVFGSFVQNITKTQVVLSTLCTLIQKTETSSLVCLGDRRGSSAIAVFPSSTSIFIFDSHSRDNSGLPCPNGTAILMKFDNIHNATLYICQLAHELSASLFHWTFWHPQLDIECDCNTTSQIPTVRPVGMLHEDEVLKIYNESTQALPEQPKRRKYYASHKRKLRESETLDQTTKRRKCDRIHKHMKRANETVEKRTQRRLSDKIRKQTKITNQTLEESVQRKETHKIESFKSRMSQKLKCETIEDAMDNFQAECKKQPIYICTSCHRLLWRKGVQHFKMKL